MNDSHPMESTLEARDSLAIDPTYEQNLFISSLSAGTLACSDSLFCFEPENSLYSLL